MKIEFVFYEGVTVKFETDIALPKFEYGCEVRTKLMQDQIVKNKLEMLHHKATDFIVEEVRITDGGECWLWGS